MNGTAYSLAPLVPATVIGTDDHIGWNCLLLTLWYSNHRLMERRISLDPSGTSIVVNGHTTHLAAVGHGYHSGWDGILATHWYGNHSGWYDLFA